MKRLELVLTVVVAMIASSVAALIATHVATSFRRVDELETRSMTIIDSKNHPIAVLSSTNDSPELAFFDQQQRKRARLLLEDNGTPDSLLVRR